MDEEQTKIWNAMTGKRKGENGDAGNEDDKPDARKNIDVSRLDNFEEASKLLDEMWQDSDDDEAKPAADEAAEAEKPGDEAEKKSRKKKKKK